jgi:hypothetical protein
VGWLDRNVSLQPCGHDSQAVAKRRPHDGAGMFSNLRPSRPTSTTKGSGDGIQVVFDTIEVQLLPMDGHEGASRPKFFDQLQEPVEHLDSSIT